MKANKLLVIAAAFSAIIASSAIAQTTGVRTTSMARTSSNSMMTTSVNHWGHHRHHWPHSRIFFDAGFGYPTDTAITRGSHQQWNPQCHPFV